MYIHVIKRGMDFLIGIVAGIVLFPVFVVIGILIKVTSKGPVFFKQKRIGRFQKEFYIIKFRTMRWDTPKDLPTHLLKKPEQYITPIGRILRKFSLDELPQIFNIVIGHMSLVGPRPALWNQKDLISQRERYGVHLVRPGLTGWAQVNGRDTISIGLKARLDGEYVTKISFLFDVKCILRTFVCVLRREGIKEGME